MRIDLMDLSILIALKIDSEDRLKNLDITMQYINNYFDTTIIISEQNSTPVLKDRYNCEYVFTESNEFFNRQKTLNTAARKSNTLYIAHYDADILLEKSQIIMATDALRNNMLDVVYPYDGSFYDVPKEYHDAIKTTNSLCHIDLCKCQRFHTASVGGAVFFKRDVFFKGGMANENFLGLGYEDNELNIRFSKLGYRIGRTDGPLYHLNHSRGNTSFNYNPHIEINKNECAKIASLSKEQLESEILYWVWI